MSVSEAEIAELERKLVHADDRGVRMLHWAPAHNTSGCWCGRFVKLLSERQEREGKLAELRIKLKAADAGLVGADSDIQRWQGRAEAAEATLVRVRELAKEYEGSHCLEDDFLPRLREALTTPTVVSSDRLTPEERKEVESRRSSPTKDWARRLGAVTDDPLLAIIDRLAPSVGHHSQEDK